jgi:acetyl esterase/lipase
MPPANFKVIRNVAQPTLMAYFPKPADANGTAVGNATAVIVCPGGAFHFLSIDHEGTDVATWLTAHGIAAFVLKYRLLRTGDDFTTQVWKNLDHPTRMAELMKPLRPLIRADGQQAVRVVRERAVDWGIRPDRIGIMGFSAGGRVTMEVALQHDAHSRPDFAAPIYGAFAGDLSVPAHAPPLFIMGAADDDLIPPAESVRLFNAWRTAERSAELHIYAKGGHGFGMRKQDLPTDTWIERFEEWLEAQGLLDPIR